MPGMNYASRPLRVHVGDGNPTAIKPSTSSRVSFDEKSVFITPSSCFNKGHIIPESSLASLSSSSTFTSTMANVQDDETERVVHPLFRTQLVNNSMNIRLAAATSEPAESNPTSPQDKPSTATSAVQSIESSSKTKKKSKGSKSSGGEEKKKKRKKKSSEEKKHHKSSKSAKKKKKKNHAKDEKGAVAADQVDHTEELFQQNIRKLKTLTALKKSFGAKSEQLVQGEKKSDMNYKRRTSELLSEYVAQANLEQDFYDWDTSLLHSPLPKEEIAAMNVDSAIMRHSGTRTARSPENVNWPSDPHNLCQVAYVTGYDELLKALCFYNDAEIEQFRIDKHYDENPTAFEPLDSDSPGEASTDGFWSSSDDDDLSYEEEIIDDSSEGSDSSYYEEEIIEEEIRVERLFPTKQSFDFALESVASGTRELSMKTVFPSSFCKDSRGALASTL
eukprot:scaffold18092_cov93-Cylindrotheca_fusiformis.AAC.2